MTNTTQSVNMPDQRPTFEFFHNTLQWTARYAERNIPNYTGKIRRGLVYTTPGHQA